MRLNTLLLAILVGVVIISCEDNFNPLGEYSERYVLNCVVKSDTNLQVATVTQSYLGSSVDPYENKSDPFVDGVYLRLWYDDEVYIFKDTIITDMTSGLYNTPVKAYYVDNLVPEPGKDMEIEALLPNGRRLNANSTVPARPRKESGVGAVSIPPTDTDIITVQWYSDVDGLTYHPKLTVVYFKSENGVRARNEKQVPIEYYNNDGEMSPIYASPSSSRNINISMDDMTKLMKSISEGDENKRAYEFMFVIIEVLAFDRNLSLYYASSSTILDEYSIKLDETDFTNVDGGFGVFGSYSKGTMVLKFDTEYLETMGYRNGLD